jgi:hypothetical protein
LLEIANAIKADHACRLAVSDINTQFRDAGGSTEEYRAAVTAAVAHGWIVLHPSGAYVTFTQAGRTCSRRNEQAWNIAASVQYGAASFGLWWAT